MAKKRERDPSYGNARQPWQAAFVEYMNSIVDHPNYAGMPCARDDEGKIDWTIPSNRPRGSKNWDGNRLRKQWWREKAAELEIPEAGKWISQVAKAIHPFRQKPCQTCGRVMEISYVYPRATTISQLNRLMPTSEHLDPGALLTIDQIVDKLVSSIGLRDTLDALSEVFGEEIIGRDAAETVVLIRDHYCARESRRFSPGVMSNAPDRLDGFHTYNLCCRSARDRGRARENLATYTVDRRAYEQWCQGDWAVADLVMTQVGAGQCTSCGAEGPLSADHIGPISLGFAHSPFFRPLCGPCNSAKNNRMSADDVHELVRLEGEGMQVVSWHASELWNRCKDDVQDDRDALLLSKLLRINQHHYLAALHEAIVAGIPDVIVQFLQPQHAYFRIELEDFDPSRLSFDRVVHVPRQDAYVQMRAARMVRVALDSLKSYGVRNRRNVQLVADQLVEDEFDAYRAALADARAVPSPVRDGLVAVVESAEAPAVRDEQLKDMREDLEGLDANLEVRRSLKRLMLAYARVLHERFERGEAVNWDDLAEPA